MLFSHPLIHHFIFLSIQRYLQGQVITGEQIEEAKLVYDQHLGPGLFNYDGWKYILDHHGGRLPLRIKAIPEGTVVPVKNGNQRGWPFLLVIICLSQSIHPLNSSMHLSLIINNPFVYFMFYVLILNNEKHKI